MFSTKVNKSVVVPVEACVQHMCGVDQFLTKDFNLNDAGWLRNDLSALAAAQTKEQYELILHRLKELPSKSNIPEGTHLRDAFDMIKPRMMQTENEFVDFALFMTEKGIKNAESAYAADMARKFANNPAEKPAEKTAV